MYSTVRYLPSTSFFLLSLADHVLLSMAGRRALCNGISINPKSIRSEARRRALKCRVAHVEFLSSSFVQLALLISSTDPSIHSFSTTPPLSHPSEIAQYLYISLLKGPSAGNCIYSACFSVIFVNLAPTCSKCNFATCSSRIFGKT